MALIIGRPRGLEWLWESFYFRWHSRLRCLRLLPLRRRPTSCAKLSERTRLITVAPTLSPMPNGRTLSGANGAAEFASSAIAFRRIDYWLKPRWNASARLSLRAPRSRSPIHLIELNGQLPSGSSFVFDCANNRGENGAASAASDRLRDDATDAQIA